MKIALTYLFAALLCSCAAAIRDSESSYSESNQPTKSETKLLDEFEKNELNAESLDAFDRRSTEKIKELFELILVVNNQDLDTTLRKKAMENCLAFFDKNEGSIQFLGAEMPLSLFFRKVYNNEVSISQIASTTTELPFTAVQQGVYKGKISFAFVNSSLSGGETVTILKKGVKSFGDDTKEVWEIFFSDLDIYSQKQ